MNKTRKTLFISDLHLDESHPKITEHFLQLLQTCDESIDAIYILGDLFEGWIGDDENTPLQQQITAALKAVTDKHIPIYFMYGNRDFLIGKKFLRASGCKLLSDEEVITLYGTPILLMHGDTLCTRDTAYMKARKTARNRFLQFLFLLAPLSYRKKFREKMRMKSAAYKQSASLDIMDVTQTEVVRVMQKHNVQHLIHGHTHRPAFHDFKINDLNVQRIVLPAWHEQGWVLIWDATGRKELVTC